jgi:DNA-binding NarL/FixJ family response regulator
MQPRQRLTAKESQVATLVWEGLTNRDIARIIGTTEQVVKNYLRTTFDKLGVWSRLELALYVAAHGGAEWLDSLRGDHSSTTSPNLLRTQPFRKTG